MSKPHITRTLGPIHFEDLDPHRFEDLVRQLIYDFKQWQSIESTGRGGADDGFDVRAYETLNNSERLITNQEDEEIEGAPHPMEGNLWMIQCKREKFIGPKKVETIVDETVNTNSPPYGYILAAPANFSKAAHDKFREGLRERGVMEFYMWGAGELEDMLCQPKNDRILFSFFGVSLTSKRKSRATEVRSRVNIKNKIMRAFGNRPEHKTILLRDLEDTNYPYEDKYKDFSERPRWKEYSISEFHPLGIVCEVGSHYAYWSEEKNEWDYSSCVNTITRHEPRNASYVDDDSLRLSVKNIWEQIPHLCKAKFIRNGLIKFDDIALVDDKGDVDFDCPHLYVDFDLLKGPFSGYFQYVKKDSKKESDVNDIKKIDYFSEDFECPEFGKIYENQYLETKGETSRAIIIDQDNITLYCWSGDVSYLRVGDVIGLENVTDYDGKEQLIKITNTRTDTGKKINLQLERSPHKKSIVEKQLGAEIKPRSKIHVIEAIKIYDWQIEQRRPVV